MKRQDPLRRRRVVITVAAVIAIVLYGAGLLSGLYVSKAVSTRQQAEVSLLVDYIDSLETDLRSFQIQERFVDSLRADSACAISQVYFDQIAQTLTYYWRVLPNRLEEYERDHELSGEYVQLKKQYTTTSLHAWLISRNNYNECKNVSIIPILYLYSKDCESCVQQGETLDTVKAILAEENRTVLPFTIDAQADDTALALIEAYYGINSTPALVVNERVLQGRVFTTDEIREVLER